MKNKLTVTGAIDDEATACILIHEAHCGPFARPKHARKLVKRLSRRGWAVAYTPRICGLVWTFPDYGTYVRFEKALEQELEAMAGGGGAHWHVDYPCPEPECGCSGRVYEPVMIGSYYLDHDRAASYAAGSGAPC